MTSVPRARSASMSAATPSSQAVRGAASLLVHHQRAADLHDQPAAPSAIEGIAGSHAACSCLRLHAACAARAIDRSAARAAPPARPGR